MGTCHVGQGVPGAAALKALDMSRSCKLETKAKVCQPLVPLVPLA